MKRNFVFDDGKTRKFVVQKEFGKFGIYEKSFLSDTFVGNVSKEEQVVPFLEGKYGKIKSEFWNNKGLGYPALFFIKNKEKLLDFVNHNSYTLYYINLFWIVFYNNEDLLSK